MSDGRPDIWRVADALQMDLRAAQAKLVELRSLLSGLSIPERPACPLCGYRSAMNLPPVNEHMRDHHGLTDEEIAAVRGLEEGLDALRL